MQTDRRSAEAMGRAVRAALAEAQMTHAEAALMVGVSLATFSRRIAGDPPFTWPELVAVSHASGVPVAALVAAAERIAAHGDAA